MGPVRGMIHRADRRDGGRGDGAAERRATSLLIAALVLPSPAHAKVCDTLRPEWDGTSQSMLAEMVGLFLSPAGLFLSAALAMALMFRHTMGTAIVALLWSFFITALVMGFDDPVRAAAVREGCVAPPTLFIAASTAICLAAVIYTFRREKRL